VTKTFTHPDSGIKGQASKESQETKAVEARGRRNRRPLQQGHLRQLRQGRLTHRVAQEPILHISNLVENFLDKFIFLNFLEQVSS
jgi:hypothetical protein